MPHEPVRWGILRTYFERGGQCVVGRTPIARNEVVQPALKHGLEFGDDSIGPEARHRRPCAVKRIRPVARVDGHRDGGAFEANHIDAPESHPHGRRQLGNKVF
eukprot:scaffold59039_cov29-Tisochrysis_lutea.AAC.1